MKEQAPAAYVTRYSLPPFRGPHTEASKIQNEISNTGQKRNPDFGPKISAAMIDVWKRKEYRNKRNHSSQTRNKIAESLEAHWHDEEYKSKMLKTRRTKSWREGPSTNMRKRWRGGQFAEEIDLWNYAQENQLLPGMVSAGYFTEEKLGKYKERLFGDVKSKPFARELEKFSLAVVQLA